MLICPKCSLVSCYDTDLPIFDLNYDTIIKAAAKWKTPRVGEKVNKFSTTNLNTT